MLEKSPILKNKSQQSPRHFLDIADLDSATLRKIIDNAHAMKRAGKRVPAKLRPAGVEDAVLVLIFEKPSTRTRVSFDIAMRQLGGGALTLNHTDLQLGRGESVADTARVLSRYADGIMIRANKHATLLDLAQNATIPVINGLTEKSHPCQIMADIQTFEEHLGPIEGRTVAWVGDGNNVAVSWMHAAVRFGFKLRLACPKELYPEKEALDWVKREKGNIELSTDPVAAVKGADCVVTDTWVSMGQSGADARKKMLAPYAVDADLMKKAAKNAIFMHCLPAYRGHEVSEEVLEGPQSVVFDEAENRLHAQKAIIAWCLGA
ncbi:ornithine carbamoyltransferase [Hyphomicrobium methylovorum]|uniref:ornithine carbamoyltransferase n=1 Tax=Hyphomicrobium methylovorum TaxID=84 RepID=UPI0015E7C001|nr:ornithine carbamoyltransferase [Hyphomicrobium methylovorum]MBA2126459.1 ornithine carbamoyltransferase [Hyphomicrobium methylovorum]